MKTFELEELLADAEGKPWLPFLDVSSLTVGIYTVRGCDIETHRPHTRDEVYYVLRGAGTVAVEGEERTVREGSVIFVPAGREHHYQSADEKLVMLVFFSSAAPAAG